MRKTAIEIIEETVQYYSEDTNRRGTKISGGCHYYITDAKQCAVGRCLIDPRSFEDQVNELQSTDNGIKDTTIYEASKAFNIDDKLKEEYRGHPIKFWEDLQELHDNNNYWNSYGLTSRGEEYVTLLNNQHNA